MPRPQQPATPPPSPTSVRVTRPITVDPLPPDDLVEIDGSSGPRPGPTSTDPFAGIRGRESTSPSGALSNVVPTATTGPESRTIAGPGGQLTRSSITTTRGPGDQLLDLRRPPRPETLATGLEMGGAILGGVLESRLGALKLLPRLSRAMLASGVLGTAGHVTGDVVGPPIQRGLHQLSGGKVGNATAAAPTAEEQGSHALRAYADSASGEALIPVLKFGGRVARTIPATMMGAAARRGMTPETQGLARYADRVGVDLSPADLAPNSGVLAFFQNIMEQSPFSRPGWIQKWRANEAAFGQEADALVSQFGDEVEDSQVGQVLKDALVKEARERGEAAMANAQQRAQAQGRPSIDPTEAREIQARVEADIAERTKQLLKEVGTPDVGKTSSILSRASKWAQRATKRTTDEMYEAIWKQTEDLAPVSLERLVVRAEQLGGEAGGVGRRAGTLGPAGRQIGVLEGMRMPPEVPPELPPGAPPALPPAGGSGPSGGLPPGPPPPPGLPPAGPHPWTPHTTGPAGIVVPKPGGTPPTSMVEPPPTTPWQPGMPPPKGGVPPGQTPIWQTEGGVKQAFGHLPGVDYLIKLVKQAKGDGNASPILDEILAESDQLLKETVDGADEFPSLSLRQLHQLRSLYGRGMRAVKTGQAAGVFKQLYKESTDMLQEGMGGPASELWQGYETAQAAHKHFRRTFLESVMGKALQTKTPGLFLSAIKNGGKGTVDELRRAKQIVSPRVWRRTVETQTLQDIFMHGDGGMRTPKELLTALRGYDPGQLRVIFGNNGQQAIQGLSKRLEDLASARLTTKDAISTHRRLVRSEDSIIGGAQKQTSSDLHEVQKLNPFKLVQATIRKSGREDLTKLRALVGADGWRQVQRLTMQDLLQAPTGEVVGGHKLIERLNKYRPEQIEALFPADNGRFIREFADQRALLERLHKERAGTGSVWIQLSSTGAVASGAGALLGFGNPLRAAAAVGTLVLGPRLLSEIAQSPEMGRALTRGMKTFAKIPYVPGPKIDRRKIATVAAHGATQFFGASDTAQALLRYLQERGVVDEKGQEIPEDAPPDPVRATTPALPPDLQELEGVPEDQLPEDLQELDDDDPNAPPAPSSRSPGPGSTARSESACRASSTPAPASAQGRPRRRRRPN
jgi:hypothetical protein